MTDPTPKAVAFPEGPLWMMHVLGPDDIYAAPDHATAVQWCADLNRQFDGGDVLLVGVPALWIGTPEAHAEQLPLSVGLWGAAAPQASLPPVEGVREAVARLETIATAYERVDHTDWAAMMPPDVAEGQKADAVAIRTILAALSPVPTGGGEPVGLRDHFLAMQRMATAYLMPEDYRDRDGKVTPHGDHNNTDQWKQGQRGVRAEAFANDMIYMLDGPEERAALSAVQPSPLARELEHSAIAAIAASSVAPVPAVEAGAVGGVDMDELRSVIYTATHHVLPFAEVEMKPFSVQERAGMQVEIADKILANIGKAVLYPIAPSAPREAPASPPAETGEGVGDLERRAFDGANARQSVEFYQKLVRDLWKAACDGSEMVAVAALSAQPVSPSGREAVAWRHRRKGQPNVRWTVCEGEPGIRDTHEVRALVDAHPASDQSDTERMRDDAHERWGILNHLGTVWTDENFETEKQAAAYLDRWKRDNPKMDLSKHRVVPVLVTITAALAEKAADK